MTNHQIPMTNKAPMTQSQLVIGALVIWWSLGLGHFAAADADLKEYDSKYYTIYTDLPEAGVHEASIRMTTVAEAYSLRTRDFAGAIDRKMPFYLYKNPEDYWKTGAPKTSAGFFNGE